jgi:putative transposase
MIDRGHKLPLTRQAALLRLGRGSLYYTPRAVPAGELAVMRRIDELHLNYPFAGSRMLRDLLRAEDVVIGREKVAALMRRMGIEAVYRRPNTSKPAPDNMIYPYLLRGMTIGRPNQVWAMDITYIPMARGFVYLAAVVDWFSRRVLAWKLSLTLDVEFCIEAVDEALAQYGRPEIFNTDQGSQFTSGAFTGLLLDHRIAISMDGKAAWRDNVCRAALALGEIRGGVPTCLCQRGRGPRRAEALLEFLQWTAPAFQPWRAHTRYSLLRRGLAACGRLNNSRPVSGASLQSGYALLAQGSDTGIVKPTRQSFHLQKAKRCSDQPGHLYNHRVPGCMHKPISRRSTVDLRRHAWRTHDDPDTEYLGNRWKFSFKMLPQVVHFLRL